MASIAAQKRLTKEYNAMETNPPPLIRAVPNEQNILEWHYLITGAPDTPYEDGEYHGVLLFPPEYPYKPPSIKMTTPSGRFVTNYRLCLNISDYHPDTWNPAWSVSSIMIGLQSFMNSNEITTGSISTSDADKRRFAKESKRWNTLYNPAFCKHYPEEAEFYRELFEDQQKYGNESSGSGKAAAAAAKSDTAPTRTTDAKVATSETSAPAPASTTKIAVEEISDFESEEDDFDFDDVGDDEELYISEDEEVEGSAATTVKGDDDDDVVVERLAEVSSAKRPKVDVGKNVVCID